jgi:hypothetical protein
MGRTGFKESVALNDKNGNWVWVTRVMFFTVNWFGSDGFVRLGAVGLGVGASSGLSYSSAPKPKPQARGHTISTSSPPSAAFFFCLALAFAVVLNTAAIVFFSFFSVSFFALVV